MKILTREERQLLYRKHEGLCALCGEHVDFGEMNVDHTIPIIKDGPDTLENMQIAHQFCNYSKGKRDRPVNKLPARHPIYTDKRLSITRYEKEKDLDIRCDLRPVDIMIPVAVKEVLDVYCSQTGRSKTQVLCDYIQTLESQFDDKSKVEIANFRRWREKKQNWAR